MPEPSSEPVTSGLRDRLATRLVLGMLLAVLPLVAVLSVLLVRNASDSLDEAARDGLRNSAVQLASRVDQRFAARRAELDVLATEARDGVAAAEVVRAFGPLFETLQLVDVRGRLLAGSDRSGSLARPAEDWFAVAARGGTSLAPVRREDGTLRTVLAQGVVERDGDVRRVLLGDLDETVFAGFVGEFRLGRTGEAVIRDAEGRLIWRTGLGRVTEPQAMALRDTLRDRTTEGAPGLALQGRTGTTEFVASNGREALGGYAPVRQAGWAVDVRQDTSEAFEPIDDQRRLAILIAVLGSLLAAGFAVLFARRVTRPLTALGVSARRVAAGDLTATVEPAGGGEVADLGRSFNAMVSGLQDLAEQVRAAGREMSTSSAQLSTAAQELASTVTEQSSSATETSSTMQELATSSASIADSVGGVESRAQETRDVLASADRDLASSSDQVLALSQRANDVSAVLELIDELAGRTNLLALNAAIEAARAGEAGAGFSVVADEVRRLAERSKREAQKIREIVEGVQEGVSGSVMAIASGADRVRGGRTLMEDVADAVTQVRFTTDEQRVATEQVVQAMGSVTASSRQAAAAAQQIAESAGGLERLARELDATASRFRTGG